MFLLGSRIFTMKSVIDGLRTALPSNFEGHIGYLLSEEALSDEELYAALIARFELKPLRLIKPDWSDGDFQRVSGPDMAGLEPFYSFSRAIPFEGNPILWKQRPHKGYSGPLRLKLGINGETSFQGLCIESEMPIVDRYLFGRLSELEVKLRIMKPAVDAFNDALPVRVRRYLDLHYWEIDGMRKEMKRA